MPECTVGWLCELLNQIAPLKSQMEWDCSGLVLGRRGAPVSSFAVSLEAGPWTVRQALELGCQFLAVHHPPLFVPVHGLTDQSPSERALLEAAEAGLAVAAWHTNWDLAPRGVNFVLAQALGLTDCRSLTEGGLGLSGNLSRELSLQDCARYICRVLGLSGLRWWGDGDRPLRRLALCGGAGGEFMDRAVGTGADCYFTSEIKRHQVARALDCGLALIEADHYEVEQFTMKGLCRALEVLSGLKGRVLADPAQSPRYVQREWKK